MKLIDEYLKEKEIVWREATLRSEGARLNNYKHLLDLNNLDALRIYATLKGYGLGPYSIKTTLIRFSSFLDWCIENNYYEGQNVFKSFMVKNRQLFINAYKKEVIKDTYFTALEKLDQITDHKSRAHAKYLLATGLRISESYKLKREGSMILVIGKGGKKRRIFAENLPKHVVPQTTLRRALNKVGLKPHTLRKLYATHLLNNDIKPHELCKLMGWSNIQTAMSYLQGRDENELSNKLQEML